MKRYLAALSAACALALLAVPAAAHHSFNTFFDMTRTIQIEGVITAFRVVSPHSEMMVDVSDASGKVVTWRITARTGAGNARREGWKAEDFVGKKVGVVRGMAAERDARRRAPEGVNLVSTASFPELYAQFDAGQLDAIAEAEYYAVDGSVIPSHGPDVVLIDLHDLTPGQREESVFVARDKTTGLLEAVNAFLARTRFPLPQ